MKKHLDAFLLALTFLTRLPLPSPKQASAEIFSLSLGYMPLVGLLIGELCGLWIAGSAFLLTPHLAVLSGIIFGLVLTGVLHEDGLADCADGMVGGYTKERRLEIMKDSRNGTYGVVTLWAILSAELLLLSQLMIRGGNPYALIVPLIIANGLGRASMLALATYLPYARVENSRSSSFFQAPSTLVFLLGSLPVLILAVWLLHIVGLICIATCGIVTLAAGWYFRKKIGGITGDCLGATSKLSQVACYLALLIGPRFEPSLHHFLSWTHL